MDSDRPAAGARFAGRYRIERELGRGAMGVVYSAFDEEVGDTVALKVLALADDRALARFRREVRLARRIAHPNVARMFDLGSSGSIRFLTMEYVEGSDLRALLRQRGALPLSEALEIARQIARGLAAAHEAGVVHRDLKPANVLIDRAARVVVSDFGIARAASGDDPSVTTSAIGTPAYMAPEQLSRDADERSDLYALGIMLFEMLAGSRPKWGHAGADELLARLTAKAPELGKHAAVPARLSELVSTLLEPNPEARPQSAAAVVDALADVSGDACAPAATEPMTTSLSSPPMRPERSIVVLPFTERGSESRDLGDTLAEELSDVLARVAGLSVISSRSAQAAGGEPPHRLARQLGADVAVCGTIQRRGDRVRSTVRLIDAQSGVQLWTETFDAQFEDLFGFEELMAQKVAEALRLELSLTSERERIHPRALELYMAGRKLRRTFAQGPESAVHTLREALELAPNCRPIAAAYAMACIRACFAAPEKGGELIAEASRVIEPVDDVSDLPEAWLAKAMIAAQTGDYRTTVRWLARVVKAAPTHAEAQEYLGRLQCQAGNHVEGIRRLELAVQLDPDHYIAHEGLILHHLFRGQDEEAARWLDRLRSASASRAPALLCGVELRLSLWRGDDAAVAEYARQFQQYFSGVYGFGLVAIVHLTAGLDDDTLERTISETIDAIDNPRFCTWIEILVVEVLAHARRFNLAEQHLENAARRTLIDLDWLDHCPVLAPLRSSPRFAEVRRLVWQRAQSVWTI